MSSQKQYLYERIKDKGAHILSNADLLAITLNISTLKAQEKLEANGFSLRKTLLSTDDPLAQMAKSKAILELSSRFLEEDLQRGDTMQDPDTVKAFLKNRIRDYEHEVFCCLFLDTRHRLIKFEELFQGTIDSSSVYPREVVKRALHYNASAVIFAHNHPSGMPEPSSADERITNKLCDALALVGVRVLDHIVIGDYAVSMAEWGLIEERSLLS